MSASVRSVTRIGIVMIVSMVINDVVTVKSYIGSIEHKIPTCDPNSLERKSYTRNPILLLLRSTKLLEC